LRGISVEKAFLRLQLYSAKLSAAGLKREEVKTIAKGLNELSGSSFDAAKASRARRQRRGLKSSCGEAKNRLFSQKPVRAGAEFYA